VAILQKQFDLQPGHPGIAHYIIHSCDNPAMASLGLAAARKYAGIAPSSPHAVHMPSHIFARLGLWQDDIQSNTAAIQAADKMSAMHFHTMHHRMHSLDFMHYAYMQVGDDEKARATMEQLAHISKKDIEDDYQNYYDERLADFAARYATERRQWKEALALQPLSGALPHVQATTYWAHAVAAGHLHNAAAAQAALEKYDAMVEETRKGPRSHLASRMKNGRDEPQAWAYYAQNKKDEALKLMRAVADRQDKVGKGETEMPAREMLADMLLDMGKPQEALGEYEISLRTDPNRFNGLFGAAQAAEQAQQKQKAARYYAQLIANCQGAQSDRPELATAKTLVASN
jgi:tetratricopeptide (TPR) repeat protein